MQQGKMTVVEISDEAWAKAVERLTARQAERVARDVHRLQAEMEEFFGSRDKETSK